MNLDPLFEWVTKREAIRQRRVEGAPPPWTDDEILSSYRFCNVRREDDRVTRWIDTNVRRRYEGHDHLWFMLCACRQLNYVGTLVDLIGDVTQRFEDRRYPGAWPDDPIFSPVKMSLALEDRALRGQQVFTGAYIVTAPATKGAKKTTFVAMEVLGALWRDRQKLARFFQAEEEPSLQRAHAALTSYLGWGPFLAYQAIVDMVYCPDLLAFAADRFTWAAAGPGTIRGLNRVNGRPVDAPLSQERARDEILAIYPLIEPATGVHLDDLSDVPNVLCETDKYLRTRNGEGVPRARYNPLTAASL